MRPLIIGPGEATLRTIERVARRAGRQCADLSGPIGPIYEEKSDATEGLQGIINSDTATHCIQLGLIRTDGGGTFDG